MRKQKIFQKFRIILRMVYEKRNEFDCTIEAQKATLTKFETIADSSKNMKFMLGFDGYIDSLYRMVKSRKSQTEVEYYDSMAEFGKRIVETAGSSGSIERILKKELAGGFAPNMARAISNMLPDCEIDLFAAMGLLDIHPIFKTFSKNVTLHSVGKMGLTLAMEFHDGKLMSQDMEGIITLEWDSLKQRSGGIDNLISHFEKTDAIGNGHWALMPHMNDYWKHFITEVIPSVNNKKNKLFFVDPADLQKRSATDIEEMLSLLKKIDEEIPVVLSLNDRETIDVAKVLHIKHPEIKVPEKNKIESFSTAGKQINYIADLSYLVVHDPHFATITGNARTGNFYHWVTEGVTGKPKFTTAAGDHFNGGILLSLLAGLRPEEALIIANAVTAIFVRTGVSPSLQHIKRFVQEYFKFIENDIHTFDL